MEATAAGRDLLAEMLVEQGHEVFTASGGREGLEIFKSQVPDLVITDLGMPEVSGWEVASGVKAIKPTTSVIPTIDRWLVDELGSTVSENSDPYSWRWRAKKSPGGRSHRIPP